MSDSVRSDNPPASVEAITSSLSKLHEEWKELPAPVRGQLLESWRHDHRLAEKAQQVAEKAQQVRHALILAAALAGWYTLLGLGIGLLGRLVFLADGDAFCPYEVLVLGLFVVVAGAPPLVGLSYLRRPADD